MNIGSADWAALSTDIKWGLDLGRQNPSQTRLKMKLGVFLYDIRCIYMRFWPVSVPFMICLIIMIMFFCVAVTKLKVLSLVVIVIIILFILVAGATTVIVFVLIIINFVIVVFLFLHCDRHFPFYDLHLLYPHDLVPFFLFLNFYRSHQSFYVLEPCLKRLYLLWSWNDP